MVVIARHSSSRKNFLRVRHQTAVHYLRYFQRSNGFFQLPKFETRPVLRWRCQWFDIWSVEEPNEKKEIQVDGLSDSIEEILTIICNEALLIPPAQIVLGGISQGYATAIHALFHGGIRLGGFIGLCSWLPFQEDIADFLTRFTKREALVLIRSMLNRPADESTAEQKFPDLSEASVLETPIFLSHSQDDMVVPISNGKNLYRVLGELGLVVVWRMYQDGGHWVNEPQGVDDIVAFLQDKVRVEF